MKIHVEFDLLLPENCTPQQIDEWLRFELHQTSAMSADSPLADVDIEARNIEWSER